MFAAIFSTRCFCFPTAARKAHTECIALKVVKLVLVISSRNLGEDFSIYGIRAAANLNSKLS